MDQAGEAPLPTRPKIDWPDRLWFILLLGAAVGGSLAAEPGLTLAACVLPLAVLALLQPHRVVLVLTALVPFEDFLLKWLPVSDTAFGMSRFTTEILMYMTFGVVCISHLVRGRPLRRTPLDVPLAIFLVLAVASLVINGSPIVGSVVNLRPFLRYIILFYLVVNLDFTEEELKRIVLVIMLGLAVQIVVGLMQIIGGQPVLNFFMPRVSALDIGGESQSATLLKGREIGSIFGTLTDTVIFGVFCVMGTAISLGRIRRWTVGNLIWITTLLVMCAWSYSRASVIVAIGCVLWWFRLRYGWRHFLLVATATTVGATIAIIPVALTAPAKYVDPMQAKSTIASNLFDIFSSDYIRIAEKQRLGALIGNVPTVLANKPLLGYGPDQDTAIEHLNQSQHSFLLKVWSTIGYKDVYWVALLSFYGLLGLGAIAMMFRRLFRAAMRIRETTDRPLVYDFATGTSLIIIASSVMLFFNRAIEFRQYGFYFWLWPALMLSAHAAELRARANGNDT